MENKAAKWGIIVCVIISFVFSMSLLAAESTKQKETGIKKIEKQKKTIKELPHTTMRLPGPKINEFSCESLTGGYNINLFGGPVCVNCRLSVSFNIYARQGLSKFEIKFRGHTVHEENFGGPAVSSRSCRDLRLDLSPHRPVNSGNYTLQAKVVDRLGKIATKSISLRCDMKRPRITNVVPRDGETVYGDGNRATITFEITVSDDFTGIQEVSVTSLWIAGLNDNYYRGRDTSSPYRITINRILLGESVWSVKAVDRAGNIGEYEHINLNLTPRPVRAPARP